MRRPRFPSAIRAGLFTCCAFACAGAAPPAHALETPADVETDHLDAADDGGPRTWSLSVRPFELGFGLVGVEAGVAVGLRAVVTFECNWLAVAPTLAYGATVGVAVFPTRSVFHGFYVHPRLEAWRAPAAGDAVGAGALVGYEWTALAGPTLRLGGGLAYATWTSTPQGTAPVTFTGLLPEADVAVGWVF